MSETTVIQCPHCGASFKAKSKAALGKKVACPKCQTPFVISGSKSTSRSSKQEQKSSAQSDAWNDMWEEDDDFDDSPAPRERSSRSRTRSAGRQQSSRNSMMWMGLAAVIVIVGGGIGLIAVSTGSSDSKQQESSENLASRLMDSGQEADSTPEEQAPSAIPGMGPAADANSTPPAGDQPQTTVASTTANESVKPPAGEDPPGKESDTPADGKNHLLIFEIVKLGTTLENMMNMTKKSESFREFRETSAAQTVDQRLQRDQVASYVPGTTIVDLRKKVLTLQADPEDAKQLAKSINENPVGDFKVSASPEVTTLELTVDESENLDYKIDFEIKELDEAFEKQIAANPTAGTTILTNLLNQQLQQSIPEYIPETLQLKPDYHLMTIHLTDYPEMFLYNKINKIPSIPVNVIPVQDSIRELRSPDQIKPTQVTFKITGFKESIWLDSRKENDYNAYRSDVYGELLHPLTEVVTGYIPGSLDVNFVDQTVTFQLDHEPGKYLSKRINDNFFNDVLVSDEPIKTGPPEPPFQTPNRPMRLVVLRVTESKFATTTYFSDINPEEVKRRMAGSTLVLNSHLKGGLPGYINESLEMNPQELLIAMQLDRIPPADLPKMINSLRSFGFKVADEIVAVHEVQYDPDSSEKTLFFRIVDNQEKKAYFGPDKKRQRIDELFAYRLDRYIPGSLQLDLDKGTFNIRVRIGGDDQYDVKQAIHSLASAKWDVTYVSTTPPSGKNKAHPKGLGIVAGSPADQGQNASMTGSSEKLAEGKQLKVTIQYGLYGGRQKVSRSARSVLDGFSWVDLKTLKVDEAKKEITFHTTGAMNVTALERLLKRQKFFQVVLNSEKLPEAETPENTETEKAKAE